MYIKVREIVKIGETGEEYQGRRNMRYIKMREISWGILR